MDIERSLQDNFYLNILCYSMGKTNEAFYDKIVTLLNKYASRLYFSPIYQNELRDKGRSTVPGKDWNTGLIRCRYLVKNPSVDWAECQIYYKCHAAIVILDMNTCDVQKITEDIMKVKKMMATDQITPYRIFAFNCIQEHTLYFAEEKLSLLVSAVSRDEDLIPILQSGVEVLLYTTAIHFFMEMVRLKLDNHTIPLFNTKEEGLKDASKVKKRKQGRSLKLCGDLALILGCYKDASGYYAQGYDIVKSNDDYLWMGKTKEAQASCIYLEHLFAEKEEQSGDKVALTRVIEAIIKKMEGASNYFRKSKTAKGLEFDKECFFKLLKVLKDLGAKNNFNDFVKFYVETAKNNSAPEEHYRIMLKISGFFYEMQMFKKAGFFLKQVADAIIQDNFNPDLARDLYLACFPLYNIPLSREILPDNFPKTEFLKIIESNKQISQEIKRIAPVIQLQLINDVLALVTNDIPLQTKIISIILHYFLEDINNFTQQKLFNHLVTLGNTLNKNLKLDLTFLPEVVKLIPSPEVLKVNIKHYEGGVDKGNVFIYNPWKKGGTNVADYNWMVGNVCYIKVFLRNVFEFEVFVDMIMLVTEGVKTTNYPTSVILRKTKTLQELTLKFKPLETGTMNLLGIVSKLSNFVHFHPINAKGIAIKNYSERTTPKDNIGIRKIPIKEKISTLKVFFEETAEEIKLYEGGQFCTRVMIENKNESTVCLRKLQVSFAFTDNTTLDREVNVTDKEIQRYEQLPLIIWRAAVEDAKLAQGDLDIQPHILVNVFDVPNVDRMFKIYIKIIYYDKDKPNMSVEDNITKEVKMVKSLSVCAVQVEDSLATNQVTISGKTYNHVSADDCFYLSVEVIRDDPESNKNDYIISVYLKGVEQPLKEQIMLGSLNTAKLTARLDKESLLLAGGEAGWKDVNKLLYGKWRDVNSIDVGYLLFTNLNIAPLVEKVENSKVKFAVETSSSQGTNGQHKPVVGDLETFKIKVNILDNTKKKLYLSVIFSEEINIENAMSSKREKGVVYKGKKSFLVEFEEGKQEMLLEIRAMFMETRFYNLFCFAVDDEHGIAYSYKYPFHIKPK